MRIRDLSLLTFFLIFASSTNIYAYRAPPAKIIDQKVSKECLIVRDSFLGNQPARYGTGNKGPALLITNKCAEAVTINNVLTGKTAEDAKSSVLPIKVFLKGGEEHSKVILLTSDGEKCDDSSSLALVQAEASCKSISIPSGYALTLPMLWGSYFEVVGQSGVSIIGEMINPEEPNEMIRLVERGDIEARHNLALHYFQTKNYAEAKKVLKEGGENGNKLSQMDLAKCYSSGRCGDIPKDNVEAYFWWALAADGLKGTAAYERDYAERQLTPEQLSKVKKRLTEWRDTHQ